MENSFLWKQCRLAYKTMQLELEGSASQTTDEMKRIEGAFGVAMHTWLYIEDMLAQYRFADQKEENGFYKTLKPQFLGLIDYFILLYKSVLFQPDDGIKRKEYWEDELINCREFIKRCKAGCRYHEQQYVATDTVSVRPYSEQPVIFGNINYDNLTITPYCQLAGRIIALRKYMQYLKEKRIKSAACCGSC